MGKGEITEQLAMVLKSLWSLQYDPEISDKFKAGGLIFFLLEYSCFIYLCKRALQLYTLRKQNKTQYFVCIKRLDKGMDKER